MSYNEFLQMLHDDDPDTYDDYFNADEDHNLANGFSTSDKGLLEAFKEDMVKYGTSFTEVLTSSQDYTILPQ